MKNAGPQSDLEQGGIFLIPGKSIGNLRGPCRSSAPPNETPSATTGRPAQILDGGERAGAKKIQHGHSFELRRADDRVKADVDHRLRSSAGGFRRGSKSRSGVPSDKVPAARGGKGIDPGLRCHRSRPSRQARGCAESPGAALPIR